MERGTLKKILDSSEVSLTYWDKLGFALDTAKGMKFPRSSPPRIHRDVKSANLLVCRSWVVKVSDFGSARVVRREGERQPTNVSRSHYEEKENVNIPLLAADLHMTRNMGTILWRAPEIFALENYGTSAHVYRYISFCFFVNCLYNSYCFAATELYFGKFCVVKTHTTTTISNG